MEQQDKDAALPLKFATPLTAADEDIPGIEEVEAERKKMEEDSGSSRQEPIAEPPQAAVMPRKIVDMSAVLLPNHDKPPLAMPKDGTTTGAYLKKVREDCGLSLRQVEESTRIGLRYLEALERDDMRKMPPAVYVIAYIRKLCDFYNINPESAESMAGALREQLRCELPDAIINQVELDTEAIEDEEREVKRICWIIGGGIAGFILLVTVVSVLIWGRGGSAPAAGADVRLPDGALRQLLPPPVLETPELPEPLR